MRTALNAFVKTGLPRATPWSAVGVRPALQHRWIADNSKPDHPFEGYYTDLLDAPLHSIQSVTHTRPAAPPPDELLKTEEEEKIAKARVVFGSRLAGPAERRKQIEAQSQMVAGIMLPPRPEEPDNCCMSGCVNCVWDLYRDEMEEWAEKKAEVSAKLAQERSSSQAATSVDDDGGGSEGGWSAGGGADLFADIPVGIREFMKTEKKLKERHRLAAGKVA
jgi:hypothetical protein